MKKTGSILIVAAVMAVVLSSVRTSPAENIQPGMSSALKEMSVVYEDQFDTHDNNWPEYDGSTAYVVIDDGAYHIEHKEKAGHHVVLHPYGVPTDMDSVIHISIRDVVGFGNHAYGFVFGGKDKENNYSFQVRNGDYYAIEKMVDGNRSEVSGGPIDNVFIDRNSGKTLKLVTFRDRIRFYVDEYYVAELSGPNLPGDLVGFFVEGKVKIAVDWTRTNIKFRSNQGG